MTYLQCRQRDFLPLATSLIYIFDENRQISVQISKSILGLRYRVWMKQGKQDVELGGLKFTFHRCLMSYSPRNLNPFKH